MPRGGARPGGGRPKGAKNKRTRELEKRVAASVETFDVDALIRTGIEIVNDEDVKTGERLYALSIVLPYLRPKLAAVEVDLKGGVVTYQIPANAKEGREALRQFLGDAY